MLFLKSELELAAGRTSEADLASNEALEILRRHGNVQGPEERILMARAAVLDALRQPLAAESLRHEASRIMRSRAERIADPDLRQQIWDLGKSLQSLLEIYQNLSARLIKQVLWKKGIIESPTATTTEEDTEEGAKRLEAWMERFG